MLVGILVFGCKEKTASVPKEVHDLKEPTKFVFPDENTFFPMAPGSFWIYKNIVDGEVADGQSQDSILRLYQDNGLFTVELVRKEKEGAELSLIWKVDSAGRVYQSLSDTLATDLQSTDLLRLIACLNPERNCSIPGYRYTACGDSCALFQNSELRDTVNENIPSLEASQFMEFRQGIGLVAFGNRSAQKRLIEYRIGNGPVLQMPVPDSL